MRTPTRPRAWNVRCAGRTIVLVTHAVALTLPHADRVVVLADGQLVACGRPADEAVALALGPSASPSAERRAAAKGIEADAAAPADAAPADAAPADAAPAAKLAAAAAAKQAKKKGDGKIVEDEDRARGRANWSNVTAFLKAVGLAFYLPIAILTICLQATRPLQDFQLKGWIDAMTSSTDTHADEDRAMLQWVGAVCLFVVIMAVRNFMMPCATIRAGRNMFVAMMRNVMRARLSWFQATPVGRILNRFTSDVQTCDTQVVNQFNQVVCPD